MFVRADNHTIAKNKWRNQHIHKVHNAIQSSAKHHIRIGHGKYPMNQRKSRKKFESTKKRHGLRKALAFDFDDLIYPNISENYKRIQIRPTIHYSSAARNISDICDAFFSKYDSEQLSNEEIIIGTKPMNITETIGSQSLFEGNKIDIFDEKYQKWYIGTIMKVRKTSALRLLVHYDGFKAMCDEWIEFTDLNRVKLLHSHTLCHDYETDKLNQKVCVARKKYRQCRLCARKYCLECMALRIGGKECVDCLKLMGKNAWLRELKRGDKLDVYLYGYTGAVFNSHKWDCHWHISTVIEAEIAQFGHTMRLCVSFDGLDSKYDEWIRIDLASNSARNKVKKLNKITAMHSYLLNDTQNICVATEKWQKCTNCHRKCCLQCLAPGITVDSIGYECNKCGVAKEEKAILNSLKHSIYGKYENMKSFGARIQMNIIYTIYEYSLGITVQCCNQIKSCENEINFGSTFAMEVNAQQNSMNSRPFLSVYQYCLSANINLSPNVTIYDKKRRIFCEECTENELLKCILCNKCGEVRPAKQENNASYKCQECKDTKLRKERQKIRAKTHKTAEAMTDDENKFVDTYFKHFKDKALPEIIKIMIRKSRMNQNIKSVSAVLAAHGIDVQDLPYTLWSLKCNLPKCYRQYCAFYHCEKEKELGRIISVLSEKRKSEKRILSDASRHFHKGLNEDLMDYDFNLRYCVGKMRKRTIKINIRRKANERKKSKAYWTRKEDKRCNAKQNRKFKNRYCLRLGMDGVY